MLLLPAQIWRVLPDMNKKLDKTPLTVRLKRPLDEFIRRLANLGKKSLEEGKESEEKNAAKENGN